jgi:acyl carrier protein
MQVTETIEEITSRLKTSIIERLNLEGMTPDQLDSAAPLFGEGLGLDSIDSIELIVMLDREYGIKINDPKEGRAIFQSIQTMAEYVHQHRQK